MPKKFKRDVVTVARRGDLNNSWELGNRCPRTGVQTPFGHQRQDTAANKSGERPTTSQKEPQQQP